MNRLPLFGECQKPKRPSARVLFGYIFSGRPEIVRRVKIEFRLGSNFLYIRNIRVA